MSESLFEVSELPPKPKRHKARKAAPRQQQIAAPQVVEQAKPAFGVRTEQRDFGMEFAIRNLGLAGLLRPEDYQANIHIIRPGLAAEPAVAEWKARNGLV